MLDVFNKNRKLSKKKKKKKRVSWRYRKEIKTKEVQARLQRQQEIMDNIERRYHQTKGYINKLRIKYEKQLVSAISLIFCIVLAVMVNNYTANAVETKEIIATPSPVPTMTPSPTPTLVVEVEDEQVFNISDALEEALNRNRDTIGYISIDDTRISYPVVQRDNNVYYLKHTFTRDTHKSGAIFMDYNCDVDSIRDGGNYIIYGHKMMNGTMFSDLINYKSKKYFKEHKLINFDTVQGPMVWEVFSAYATNPSYNYIKTKFRTDESFKLFVENCKQKSIYDTEVIPTKDDTILTLSTCSFEEPNYRLVVQARLIKE